MFSNTRKNLVIVTIAFAMSALFWWPLYQGAGFIGGDLYPYFFPQKAFYADALKAGRFPLWNDLAGFGYPVLGESQTGAAYPLHLVFYRYLDLNTAYNVQHLLHYMICFVATWLFGRRIGLTETGAALSSIVFTYGWFPPRCCLEWAIITGAWLPVCLWCIESFLQTRLWRYAIGFSAAIGMQLLAGHYHLAFITDLLVVTYVSFRLWIDRPLLTMKSVDGFRHQCRKKAGLGLVLSLLAGAGLGAVQVLPTWELKQRSTRVVTGGDYDPSYGHMPPLYVTQAICPWNWYSLASVSENSIVREVAEFAAPWHWFGPLHEPGKLNEPFDLDRAIQQCRAAVTSTGTNKVEAHFYCGILPILMAVLVTVNSFRRNPRQRVDVRTKTVIERTSIYWLMAGGFALIYATGALLPIGLHVPGFSFFRGPGRYAIVTTLTIALLSGQFLGQILSKISNRWFQTATLILIFSSTCGDLWLVSRIVKYTYLVSPPRISFREKSEIRRRLLAEPGLSRLLSPGPNVANLLGVSSVPWYLGIAPAEYVDPKFAMPPIPKPSPNKSPTVANPDLIEWLSQSGVTHILNFDPIDEDSWHAELMWKGVDPLLNQVWGRDEPLYLYRFRNKQDENAPASFPGRAFVLNGTNQFVTVERGDGKSDIRRVKVKSEAGDKSTLVLTELEYPGWTVQLDSMPVETHKVRLFRAVDLPNGRGELTWSYRPTSVYVGALISLGTLFVLALISHIRFWHPKLVDRIVNRFFPPSDSC